MYARLAFIGIADSHGVDRSICIDDILRVEPNGTGARVLFRDGSDMQSKDSQPTIQGELDTKWTNLMDAIGDPT